MTRSWPRPSSMADSAPSLQLRRELRDPPVFHEPDWETVGLAKAALYDLEHGMPLSAAHLAEAMGRDDRIEGVFSTRLDGLLGAELGFGEECPHEELLREAWEEGVDEAELRKVLASGLMLGIGLGEWTWEKTATRWTPRLRALHSSLLTWRWDTRTWWLTTMDGLVEVPKDGAGGRFLVFAPWGYARGWMGGRVRALAVPWLVRNWAVRDWARYSETHGAPVKVGVVPSQADATEKERFIRELNNLGAQGTIAAPQGPDGTGFDFKLVEAVAKTHEGFESLIAHCDRSIAICLVGQNLTTEVQGGSRAAAQVHLLVRGDVLRADGRALGRALRQQWAAPFLRWNVGAVLAPTPSWNLEPPEDLNARADALQKLGGFLTAAKAAGAPVDVTALLEQFNVPIGEAPEAANVDPGGEEEDTEQGDDEGPLEAQLSARPSQVPAGYGAALEHMDDLERAGIEETQRQVRSLVDQVHGELLSTGSWDAMKKALPLVLAHLPVGELQKVLRDALAAASLAGVQSGRVDTA